VKGRERIRKGEKEEEQKQKKQS